LTAPKRVFGALIKFPPHLIENPRSIGLVLSNFRVCELFELIRDRFGAADYTYRMSIYIKNDTMGSGALYSRFQTLVRIEEVHRAQRE
jgi:hypothetical protein